MPGKFYTRGGDDGYTRLLGPGRIPKESVRIEAVGAVDEANAAMGIARSLARSPESASLILTIQRDLYGLMAELAASPENAQKFRSIDEGRVKWLEEQTDSIAEAVEIPREFIVPGDRVEGAFMDLARTVVRRAERRVADLLHQDNTLNKDLLRYLNRLSSLCFLLELRETYLAKQGEGSEPPRITLARAD